MTGKMTKDNQNREYIIPLRREWMKVPRYKRTRKSVIAIKKFVAKHMKVEDRDVDKVKLDVYLNNEMWFRGVKKPFNKIKVKVSKLDDGSVKVDFVEVPEHVKFLKARQEKIHKKVEKKAEVKEEKKEKSEEEKKDEESKKEAEKEKVTATREAMEKIAEKTANVEKHIVKTSKAPAINRMALKK